jgi:eukaryotic-like serine/threonine-protein kinase
MGDDNADIDSLFHAALEKATPEERAAYLDEACGGDSERRRRVERLLKAHDKAAAFLEQPAAGVAPTVEAAAIAERPGSVIGSYKLLQQIGEGGFGVVFMAEQQEPVRRKVALKVIKPGMDTKEVIARFEVEEQALALMSHPNIAHVIDAGVTESGRPYFVMELVRGISITEYCDKNSLGISERLKLFISVCRAIQHAHQKGIIHRDIKPSNVLVTLQDGEPLVKIIDFGVAKAMNQQLTERTLFTRFAEMIGTPMYMSPEQAGLDALDIDTRSDIYSLGVLLYEMLTGVTPFERERFHRIAVEEIRRVIREEEPLMPSRRLTTSEETLTMAARHRSVPPAMLLKSVRGDLDWVVMRCLDKNRGRRYETVSGLAADVERFLCNEPVEACPPSRMYKIAKFVKRNRAAVLVAGALATTLILGLLGTSLGWRYAIRAWGSAEEQRRIAVIAKKKANDAQKEAEDSRGKEVAARLAAETERTNAVRESAQSTLQEAQSLCEQGKVAEGMLLFTRALATAQSAKAGELEEACRFNLDAWSRELHQLVQVLEHPGRVNAVQASCDGKWLATACENGSISIWKLVKGDLTALDRPTLVLPYPGPASPKSRVRSGPVAATSVAFNPQGGSLVAGYTDGAARIWDLASGKLLGVIPDTVSEPIKNVWYWPHNDGISTLAFFPDGRKFVTAGYDGYAHVWDARTYKELFKPVKHSHWITAVAVCSHGKYLVTAGVEWSIKVWDVETGTEVAEILTRGKMHFSVDIDCRHGRIIAGSLQDETAQQWQVIAPGATRPGGDLCLPREGKPLRFESKQQLRHSGWVTCAKYSPNGAMILATGNAGIARLWDPDSGVPIGPVMRHPAGVRAGCLAPDGKTIFIGCDDGGVRVWRLARTSLAFALPHPGVVAFKKDGSEVVSCRYRLTSCHPQFWDTLSGSEIPDAPLLALAWAYDVQCAPDGRTVFFCHNWGKTITWFDADTGSKASRELGATGAAMRILLSHDGTKLLVGSPQTQVWDVVPGTPTRTTPTAVRVDHRGAREAIAITADNRMLVTSGPEQNIQLWDANTGNRIKSFPVGIEVTALDVGPSRRNANSFRVVVGGKDGAVRLFEFDGTRLLSLGCTMNHVAQINKVAFAHEGRLIVSCSNDFTVRVWHECGKPAAPPLTHNNNVSAIDVIDRRGLLVSGGWDAAAKVWWLPRPLNGNVARLRLFVSSLTGLEIDDDRSMKVLYTKPWRERMQTPLGREVMKERVYSQLVDRVRDLPSGTGPDVRSNQQDTLDQVGAWLETQASRGLEKRDIELAIQTVQTLQGVEQDELAAKTCDRLQQLIANHQATPESVGLAQQLAAMSQRLLYPGKAIEFRGITSAGTEIDWAAYRGKVVLMAFWSAESSSSLHELRTVKDAFEGYGNRGFTVLVVCKDPQHEALEKLLVKEGLPCTLIQHGDPKSELSPVAHFGITRVPTAILVDKTGIVISAKAVGDGLGQLLEQQLGSPPYGVNLLRNSGFESGLENWTIDRAAKRAVNPHHGRSCLVEAGGGSKTGCTYQQIELVGRGFSEKEIDSGTLTMKFGGWQSGCCGEHDSGMIEIAMKDSSRQELFRKDLGWFSSHHRWVLKEGSAAIVAKTRFIEYRFRATETTDTDAKAYLDDAYLIVKRPANESAP